MGYLIFEGYWPSIEGEINNLIFHTGTQAKYIDSEIESLSPSVNLTIDECVKVFDINDEKFPILFSFDNKHLSRVCIKELDFSGLNTAINKYVFANTMSAHPSDEETGFLLTDKVIFLIIPDVHFYYWATDTVEYSTCSNKLMV